VTSTYSSSDRFSWLLLDEAAEIQDIGVAFGVAKLFFPMKDTAEMDATVRTTLLDLHREELLVFFHASWDEGYNADPNGVQQLATSELEAELVAGGDVTYPPDRVLFFVRTPKGTELVESLPPDASPRVSGNVPRYPISRLDTQSASNARAGSDGEG